MKRRESGFTIIETSLVLAITGLIVTLVLVGIGNSLNQQRYTDAVNQTLDFFRGQYAQTINVQNDRSSQEGCDTGGVSDDGQMSRGASECLLVGRVVSGEQVGDSYQVTVRNVLALRDPSNDADIHKKTDDEVLRASSLRSSPMVLTTYQLDWGARLLRPGSDTPATFTLMLVRTPISGTVKTFASSALNTPAAELLGAEKEAKFCIDQKGFLDARAGSMGLRVTKDAANTSGVQLIEAGSCV